MLELKHVSAGYGETEILHDLSFRFEDGVNYCLLGPNGCGKTTLLRAMAALIPYKGEIKLAGSEISGMKRREVASHMAVLSQVSQVYFPYTVYDTVMLGRYQHMKSDLFGRPGKEDREMVERCLETVRLSDQRNRPINELSGGQRQRVFLAQVLAQDPEIILLDEPTNHLDIRHQLELIEYLKNWTAEGRHQVIGVLHDINLASRLTDRVIFMKAGRFVKSGSFASVADAALLEEIYETDIVGFMRDSLKNWSGI